jgi:predicted SnoaL-like aldol condensation-catalyzing enzyme
MHGLSGDHAEVHRPSQLREAAVTGFSSKPVVFELLDRGFGRGDRSVFERLVPEDYIQHNPFIATGRNGLLGFLDQLQTLEGNEFRPVRVLEDGPLVLLHCEWNTAGHRRALFDLFRVDNGLVVEHWDVMQDQPSETPHGRTMLDGPTEVADLERTGANKAVVEEFVRTVLVERRLDRIPDFFDRDRYIQHSPILDDGVSAFRDHMSRDGAGTRYLTLHRVVGEGNFALAQSEGTRGGKPYAFYDLFRVENGKLAEHWDVVQAIPERLAHPNGMF